MKNNLVLLLILFLVVSCTNKTTDAGGSLFSGITRALTSEELSVIESIKKEFKEQVNRESSRSFTPLGLMRKNLSELDNFKLSTLPFYNFDVEKFYANPSPERLMECMIPSDKVNVFAERDGNLKFCFSIRKENDKWTFDEYIENWGNIISWLPDSLKKADSPQCKIFIHGSREYLTYKRNGNKHNLNTSENSTLQINNYNIKLITENNYSIFFKYLNNYNNNLFVCDFENMDYFWLCKLYNKKSSVELVK